MRYIEFVRRQSKTEFFKQKNALTPLRDQSSNHVDKSPNNQDEKLSQNQSTAKENAKFSSRNQKKCNNIIQPIDNCRIFAIQERIKKVVHAHTDL